MVKKNFHPLQKGTVGHLILNSALVCFYASLYFGILYLAVVSLVWALTKNTTVHFVSNTTPKLVYYYYYISYLYSWLSSWMVSIPLYDACEAVQFAHRLHCLLCVAHLCIILFYMYDVMQSIRSLLLRVTWTIKPCNKQWFKCFCLWRWAKNASDPMISTCTNSNSISQ